MLAIFHQKIKNEILLNLDFIVNPHGVLVFHFIEDSLRIFL